VQVDSVCLQSLYAIRLNDNGTIQAEDREKLRNSQDAAKNPASSTTGQERTANYKDLLASNVTLNHLLGTDIQMVNLEKPEPNKMPRLSEEKNREIMIGFYVRHAWHRAESLGIQNSIRSGQYKEVADEKIGDLLESVNTLLEGIELTKGESEALKIFNFDVSQLTNRLNASINSNKEDLFRGLISALGTLMNSLSDALESTPNLRHDLKSLFRTGEDQLRNALEDIVTVAQLTINDVAERIYDMARSEEHKQSLQKLMPEIIEGLKEYMLSKGKDSGIKYL